MCWVFWQMDFKIHEIIKKNRQLRDMSLAQPISTFICSHFQFLYFVWSREENWDKAGEELTKIIQWGSNGIHGGHQLFWFLLWPWSHVAYQVSVLPLSPYKFSIKQGYLYVTVIFFGDEGDLNREEIIGLPSNAELKAATLIFGINHWQAPLQGISSTVMSIFAINLTNHRCADTRSVTRNIRVKLAVQS